MTKNTDSDRIAYPAIPDPLTSSDMVRLFTPSSVEVDTTQPSVQAIRHRCLTSLTRSHQA